LDLSGNFPGGVDSQQLLQKCQTDTGKMEQLSQSNFEKVTEIIEEIRFVCVCFNSKFLGEKIRMGGE